MDINRPGSCRKPRIVKLRSLYKYLLVSLPVLFLVFLFSRRAFERPKQPAVSVLSPLEGRPQSELRSALRLALSSPEKWRSKSENTGSLHAVQTVISSIDSRRAKPVVDCIEDATLPDGVNGQRVLLASNLHNNEELLPHYILQLLQLIVNLPAGSSYVSIYESGSKDQTAKWLDVLQQLLQILEVPSTIVTGGLTRAEGQDRIDFLAQVRNAALEPLWRESSNGSAWGSEGGFKADRIVFINDVYFCARDIMRLLQHDGDLVCGMDFHVDVREGWDRHWRNIPAAEIMPYGPHGPQLGYKHRKHDHLIFYDSWVSRDLAGIPFANSRPFVLHQYSLARLQKGLPFPVSCCWNGMAVLNGTFFQQGYQFRTSGEGECEASEGSFMCEDMLRAGYQRFIVDPGTRQAYFPETAKKLYTDQVNFIPLTTWEEVQAAPEPDFSYGPRKFQMTCCGKQPNGELVYWADCKPREEFTRNLGCPE